MKEIKINKVVANIGVGESGEKLQKAEKLLQDLTGQKPARGISKATHPEFGVKKHAPIGTKVTLRKKIAVDFLKKPLHDFLPILRNILTHGEPEQDLQHVSGINYSLKLKEARNIFESQYLLHHLSANDNNIAVVAEIAGLERTTLYRKLKDLGIDKK